MILVARLLRAAVGSVFVAAGIGKLLADQAPRLAPVLLGETRGAIVVLSSIVEDALPLLEVVAGLSAWAGIGRVARSALGLVLGTLFLVVAVATPAGVRCGCFGILGDFSGRATHVVASGAFLAAVVVLAGVDRCVARQAAKGCREMGYDPCVDAGGVDPT